MILVIMVLMVLHFLLVPELPPVDNADGGRLSMGDYGGGIGYINMGFNYNLNAGEAIDLYPCVFVEFDTYWNDNNYCGSLDFDEEGTEVRYDHICMGFLKEYDCGDELHSGINPIGSPTHVPIYTDEDTGEIVDVENGTNYCVDIFWKASDNTLTVYVKQQHRITRVIDIPNKLGLTSVRWGITAATGLETNTQKIKYRVLEESSSTVDIIESGTTPELIDCEYNPEIELCAGTQLTLEAIDGLLGMPEGDAVTNRSYSWSMMDENGNWNSIGENSSNLLIGPYDDGPHFFKVEVTYSFNNSGQSTATAIIEIITTYLDVEGEIVPEPNPYCKEDDVKFWFTLTGGNAGEEYIVTFIDLDGNETVKSGSLKNEESVFHDLTPANDYGEYKFVVSDANGCKKNSHLIFNLQSHQQSK
jgi:hypothetical protein